MCEWATKENKANSRCFEWWRISDAVLIGSLLSVRNYTIVNVQLHNYYSIFMGVSVHMWLCNCY